MDLNGLTLAQLIALIHDLVNQLAAADQHDDRLLRAYTDLYGRLNVYGSGCAGAWPGGRIPPSFLPALAL
jgi:hypothetical protein